jgi:aminopeptidase N
MDEGFADFSSHESLAKIFNTTDPPHQRSYASYFSLVKSGLQEPVSEHADFFSTNRAYVVASYAMGAMFLEQLKYITGDDLFYRGMKQYYSLWKFRHPEPNDFLNVMERESGMELKWFYNYWINTTKHIDYGIDAVKQNGNTTSFMLKRIGELPMPLDIEVTLKNGQKEYFYIPLNETLASKPLSDSSAKRIDLQPWLWVAPTYQGEINHPKEDIAKIEIDPNHQLADVNRANNSLHLIPPPAPEKAQSEQN